METEISLLCPQETVAGLCLELDESSPHPLPIYGPFKYFISIYT